MVEALGGRKSRRLSAFVLVALALSLIGVVRGSAAPAQDRPALQVVDPVLASPLGGAAAPGGSEPSVALNPANPREIAITSFADRWLEVFVGYAGGAIRNGHPVPWKDAKDGQITFKGLDGTSDASAIRIDNPTTQAITVDQVSVTIGTQTFGADLWGTKLTIPAANARDDGHLILTATVLGAGVETNFDGSDATDRTAVPEISITIGGATPVVYRDTAKVLTSGGTGPLVAAEGHQWTSVAGAPFWHSADGGAHWTRESIPAPFGLKGVIDCPCDQTIDYGADGRLYGAFLLSRALRQQREAGGDNTESSENVVTGSGTFAADAPHAFSWRWNEDPAQAAAAQLTNEQSHLDFADQPWLVTHGINATTRNAVVYVAYDDFRPSEPTARVALNNANVGCTQGEPCPPGFPPEWDTEVGKVTTGGVNTGLRLSRGPANRPLYAVYEQLTSKTAEVVYHLNMLSFPDKGPTWGLNGKPKGELVARGVSPQGALSGYKFGRVNALFGGVDDVAVAPDGSAYVVYGLANGADNQLFIRRFHTTAAGFRAEESLPVCAPKGEGRPICNAVALPSIAVTSDSVIGVLYTTLDGYEAGAALVSKPGRDGAVPVFSAHFVRSTDEGKTFTHDIVLEQFVSPVRGDGKGRQRVLGDYQQLKTRGPLFYGVFAGNRVSFNGKGHTASRFRGNGNSAIDPIYFSLPSRAELPRSP